MPGNIIVVATYGYESGARATATVVVHNGRVQCVQYSDDPWGCHPVGNNPGVDLYAATRLTPEEREREEQDKAYAKEKECSFDPRYC